MDAPVSLAELLNAIEWVSAGEDFDHEAFIERSTGRIFWLPDEEGLEEGIPEDVGESDGYVSVPRQKDLDLGRRLVMRFVEEHAPQSVELVHGFFRRRGAYARFSDFLDRFGLRDAWHEYRDLATEQALREWCEDNGLQVVP